MRKRSWPAEKSRDGGTSPVPNAFERKRSEHTCAHFHHPRHGSKAVPTSDVREMTTLSPIARLRTGPTAATAKSVVSDVVGRVSIESDRVQFRCCLRTSGLKRRHGIVARAVPTACEIDRVPSMRWLRIFPAGTANAPHRRPARRPAHRPQACRQKSSHMSGG